MVAYNPEHGGDLIDLSRDYGNASEVKFNDVIGIGQNTLKGALDAAIPWISSGFEGIGLSRAYNSTLAKGVTPRSKTPYDIAEAIMSIVTSDLQPPSGTFNVGTTRSETYSPSSDIDMSTHEGFPFRYVNTSNVKNRKLSTLVVSKSDPDNIDMKSDNDIQTVNAENKYEQGYEGVINSGYNNIQAEISWAHSDTISKSKEVIGQEIVAKQDGVLVYMLFCDRNTSVYPHSGFIIDSNKHDFKSIAFYGVEFRQALVRKGSVMAPWIKGTKRWWTVILFVGWPDANPLWLPDKPHGKIPIN